MTILIILSCILLFFYFYFYKRIDKVADFRSEIIDYIFCDIYCVKIKMEIFKKISFEKMVFSFKSLKLENFFSQEEIEILKKNYTSIK